MQQCMECGVTSTSPLEQEFRAFARGVLEQLQREGRSEQDAAIFLLRARRRAIELQDAAQ